MNDEQRALFLAERRDCIGGSDVHHLLGRDRGCERRLWYDKVGVAPDFDEENKHMRRGSALEAPAIAEFNREAQGIYHAAGPLPWASHPDHPFMGAHIDGLVTKGVTADEGVLEVKVPTSYNWHKMRMEGPQMAHVLQLQWYMMVADKTWGLIYAFNADAWHGHWWEVERDPEAAEDLLYLAKNLWQLVLAGRSGDVPGPDRLDGRDPRCRVCPWRRTCQGIDKDWLPPEDRPDPGVQEEHDEALFDLVSDYLAAQELKRAGERAFEEARDRLRERLGQHPRLVSTSAGRVVLKEQFRKAYSVPEWRGLTLRVVPRKVAEDGEGETEH